MWVCVSRINISCARCSIVLQLPYTTLAATTYPNDLLTEDEPAPGETRCCILGLPKRVSRRLWASAPMPLSSTCYICIAITLAPLLALPQHHARNDGYLGAATCAGCHKEI